jgi:hypothetical protein
MLFSEITKTEAQTREESEHPDIDFEDGFAEYGSGEEYLWRSHSEDGDGGKSDASKEEDEGEESGEDDLVAGGAENEK